MITVLHFKILRLKTSAEENDFENFSKNNEKNFTNKNFTIFDSKNNNINSD